MERPRGSPCEALDSRAGMVGSGPEPFPAGFLLAPVAGAAPIRAAATPDTRC
jgi:hypothetical protein